ncbi:MAG: hypothetical protein AB8Y51_01395, partial [Coxiella endosymbiont of Haemaphysalis qinghaiensis]
GRSSTSSKTIQLKLKKNPGMGDEPREEVVHERRERIFPSWVINKKVKKRVIMCLYKSKIRAYGVL